MDYFVIAKTFISSINKGSHAFQILSFLRELNFPF